MDRLHAYFMVLEHAQRSEDAVVREAARVLVAGGVPDPPGALGVLGGNVRQLAHIIDKTGLAGEWATPPLHSRAMERLIHRLTVVLESFLDVYEDARQPAAAELNGVARSGLLADEAYQCAYCDDCGCELRPNGDCPACKLS